MTFTKEDYELAALAAGIDPELSKPLNLSTGVEYYWNPPESDKDALRLAIVLSMRDDIGCSVFFPDKEDLTAVFQSFDHEVHTTVEVENNDPYAATRHAIFKAAIERGKQMKGYSNE